MAWKQWAAALMIDVMERKRALVIAGTVTAVGLASAMAIGATFGLFGLADNGTKAGSFDPAAATAGTPSEQTVIVDVPMPGAAPTGGGAVGGGASPGGASGPSPSGPTPGAPASSGPVSGAAPSPSPAQIAPSKDEKLDDRRESGSNSGSGSSNSGPGSSNSGSGSSGSSDDDDDD